MIDSRIRVVAICVFRNGCRILVARGWDGVAQSRFYRPLGGSVEFGETSIDAVGREIREELGQEICSVALLGVLENLFEYEGRRCHEIVFVYDGEFLDRQMYERSTICFTESGWEGDAVWISLDEPLDGRLVPEGLDVLLTKAAVTGSGELPR